MKRSALILHIRQWRVYISINLDQIIRLRKVANKEIKIAFTCNQDEIPGMKKFPFNMGFIPETIRISSRNEISFETKPPIEYENINKIYHFRLIC